MSACRLTLCALFAWMLLAPVALAQRVRKPDAPADQPAAEANVAAPTIVGRVVSYEADKSIVLETRSRDAVKKSEFRIVKDRTKIEIPARAKEIAVGMNLAVWADKDDPQLAARIGQPPAGGGRGNRRPNNPANPGRQAAAPAAVGKVAAYEAGKSLSVEIAMRGGQSRKTEFSIVKDQTKVELLGGAKEVAAGLPVSVWTDKDKPDVAVRIVVGTANPQPRRPNNRPANPNKPPPPRGASEPGAARAQSLPVTPKPARQPVAGLAPREVARQIDEQIESRLAAEKVPASPQSSDAEFMRRVYLDITGVIPPADKVTEFLESQDPDKRARLIDALLAGPSYGQHFADLWCERLVTRDLAIETEPFVTWLADALNKNRGWNEIVTELVTAEGRFSLATRGRRMATADPQAFFVLLNTDNANAGQVVPKPEWLAAESSRLFLGVQIQCAECHDHPFTKSWKQTDFWGLAAFFGQFRTQRDQPMGLAWRETPAAAGEPVSIAIPATALTSVGKVVPARLLGQEGDYLPSEDQLLRQHLAQWMTAADNLYFAQGTANRLWAHFFGRGLVQPVDDLRPDNPPSHPAILELLAGEIRKSDFDLKHQVRCLCLSQAYQRTSLPLAPNEQDGKLYSHMALKVLEPGTLYDSLTVATGLADLQLGLPRSKTVVTTITTLTPRESFLGFYRAAAGEEPDPLEYMHGIPQKLKLLNASQLSGIFPVAEQLANRGLVRDQAIEQLYLTARTRLPTADEASLMAEFLERRKDASPAAGYSAVLWALVNSSEFVLNR